MAAAATCAAFGMTSCAEQEEGRMNIVFILADDMGIGDLGCYGQEKIQTPNIDRMAQEGILFDNAYSGASVSAPSRCTIMTGLHTGHCVVRGLPKFTSTGLPVDMGPKDSTIAQVLQEAGYETALIGKWGLAESGMDAMPPRKGFDYFFGYKTHVDAHHYYPEYLWCNEEKVMLPQNDMMAATGEYSQDMFTEEALDYLTAHKDGKPFFLYLSYCLPHFEITVPEDSRTPYENLGWDKRPLQKGHYRNDAEGNVSYAGMVSRLDRYVGQIMEALKANGLAENTLVIFTSDNGKEYDQGFFDSTMGLRGEKRELYEGGIRAPFIAWCPGTVPGGETSSCLTAFWDLYPTFAEIAGSDVDPRDGISILPALTGKPMPETHDYLYWEVNMKQGPIQAARFDRLKAVRFLGKDIEIYDLTTDPSERHDIAAAQPEAVEKAARIFREGRTENEFFPMDRWVWKK